jgi:hypothetical protein
MYAAVAEDHAGLRHCRRRHGRPVRDVGRLAARGDRLGEPEIEHLDRSVRPQLDVRGLQVAVDDSLFVGRFERVGDLPGDLECLAQ